MSCMYRQTPYYAVSWFIRVSSVTVTFNIADLAKEDECIDLSNRDIFEDISDYRLITLNPEVFFHYDYEGIRTLILIAPKSLVEEKFDTSSRQFKWIMYDWNDEHKPIGVFHRMEYWNDLTKYDFSSSHDLIINLSMDSLCMKEHRRPRSSCNIL